MIEEIKDISDLLIGSDSLKNFLNSLVVKINNFEREIKDIKEGYCKELNKKDEFLENQKKEIKVKINNFVEEFQEYKEDFYQEMKNEDIVNKLIEKFKEMFIEKNNEIKNLEKEKLEVKNLAINLERANIEIDKKKLEIENLNKNETNLKNKKEELEKEIEKRETNINNLKKEIEDLNKNYKLEKEELNNQYKILNDKKIQLEKDIENLSEEYGKLKKSNIELMNDKKEKEKKLKKLMEKCEEFKDERDSIGDLLEARKIYDSYLEMDARIKSKLEDILMQKDFESFISSGYSTSTIDNIWDIIKIEYKNILSEDLEKLKEIFKFFIIQINKRFKEEKYGLIEANLGEEFDAVTQVDLSQNSRGKIVEFVFYGYGFLKDKKDLNIEDRIDKIIKNPLVLTR